jgi:hypothetical protein
MIDTNEQQPININETLAEIKSRLQLEYPTLKTGSDQNGYTELDDKSYKATIAEWAQTQMGKINAKKAEIAKGEAKSAAQAKLAALGLTVEDLTALGL